MAAHASLCRWSRGGWQHKRMKQKWMQLQTGVCFVARHDKMEDSNFGWASFRMGALVLFLLCIIHCQRVHRQLRLPPLLMARHVCCSVLGKRRRRKLCRQSPACPRSLASIYIVISLSPLRVAALTARHIQVFTLHDFSLVLLQQNTKKMRYVYMYPLLLCLQQPIAKKTIPR